MNLVIDRSRWLRGSEDGKLLDGQGRMCCLGFFAIACGYRPADITELASPEEVCASRGEEEGSSLWPTWLLSSDEGRTGDSNECNKLIRTNDSRTLGEVGREREIASAFARHGVNVRFVDEPETP